MKKQNLILSAALAAVFSTSAVFAEAEVTGKIVHESGFFSNAGSTIGDFGVSTITGTGPTYQGVSTTTTPSHAKRDAMKRETSARIYIDGEVDELQEGATYHVELNLMKDSKGTSNYDSNESYTQRDPLREAYIDSQVGDWSLRTGKQQVVWGTADGMKLLDTINPTDYGEMAQNQMEDSRIPVWMINAETTNEDGSEFQVIVSQPKENVFAGLNRNTSTHVRKNSTSTLDDTSLNGGTDTGHAFMMMGPDTITGASDGFLNIVPDLGSVATRYEMAFDARDAIDMISPTGVTMNNLYDARMQGFTVASFKAMKMNDAAAAATGGSLQHSLAGATFGPTGGQNGILSGTPDAGGTGMSGGNLTDAIATVAGIDDTLFANIPAGLQKAIWQVADVKLGGTGTGAKLAALANGAARDAALSAVSGSELLAYGFNPLYDTNLANLTSADDSAFDYMGATTFRTFDAFANAKSQYVYNMPSDSDLDLALRYKNSTSDGVNYSLNTSYNYDKNPIIDLSWRGNAGQKLDTHKVTSYFTQAGAADPTKASAGGWSTTTLQLIDPTAAAVIADTTAVNTHETAKFYGGSVAGVTIDGVYGGTSQQAGRDAAATLQFSQEVKRVKQIGGSFDMAIETEELGPVVIRGEALYTKDGYSPVINKDKLAIGDLVGTLQMVKADRFKFVLGADITALTNMMISAQFIQDSNLDFVDGANNYTADYATMSMSNGFNKAIKDKNFYSLFFSKPFGASGEHRWNNITMLEEGLNGNGKWNRLDAEFSIDDDTQATIEYNKYWGDANTQFGQLEKSSNVQVGFKYSF